MRDDLSVSGDYTGGQVDDWLVTGWFTEDATYQPLAEAFAANLREHGVPFHLFAKPSVGAWNTGRKPLVVLEAMDAYPGKAVVLMDVDCVVRGDIAPVTRIDADVGVVVIARNVRKGKRLAHWIATECSSRVVVFRPTKGARAFAMNWSEQIARSDISPPASTAWCGPCSPAFPPHRSPTSTRLLRPRDRPDPGCRDRARQRP